jgi:hypothetical protein
MILIAKSIAKINALSPLSAPFSTTLMTALILSWASTFIVVTSLPTFEPRIKTGKNQSFSALQSYCLLSWWPLKLQVFIFGLS